MKNLTFHRDSDEIGLYSQFSLCHLYIFSRSLRHCTFLSFGVKGLQFHRWIDAQVCGETLILRRCWMVSCRMDIHISACLKVSLLNTWYLSAGISWRGICITFNSGRMSWKAGFSYTNRRCCYWLRTHCRLRSGTTTPRSTAAITSWRSIICHRGWVRGISCRHTNSTSTSTTTTTSIITASTTTTIITVATNATTPILPLPLHH